MGFVLVFLLGAAPVFANTHIKLMGDTSIWPQFSRMDLESLKPHAGELSARMLSIPQGCRNEFKGFQCPVSPGENYC